ncbi:MAG: 50S ribosomal protein L10 [Elusimicrobia bacterium CG_4_9_14_3_um_filter_62_55]|nr:MAG: 50S ribosomal protein L10 [Elusimicrobia bacterium CG22_combo_CG10-13_8_21_14_all_63_91]PJA17065.1 MAG: 50S ribosomal protein L10 [Elusimicrobia bacterium CG_4_10_14_0_2_um_filter_63_34]PJB25096.1 MAG: 50S ribosomal protein L10 [Elusimicrobia bacterium CG_4_9_14_3_um_filter_62_55]
MKLTKEQKKDQSKELGAELKASSHVFFTHYQGLKFEQMETIRTKLRPMKCRYTVLKNSLLASALKEAGIEISEVDGGEGLLSGPNAVLIAKEDDPVSPAKVLVDMQKEAEKLDIRAGFVGGKWIGPDQVKALSKIGTKPELLGQLANALYSSVAQGAWVLAAPIRDLVLVLKAVEEQKKSEGGA